MTVMCSVFLVVGWIASRLWLEATERPPSPRLRAWIRQDAYLQLLKGWRP